MNLLKTIGKSIAIPALNWYKIGAMVLVLTAWTVFVDQRATHRCELKHEKQRTEQAETRLEKVAEHVQERMPVINKKQEDTATLHAEISKLRGKLKDAIYANQTRNSEPSCDLTLDEYDSVRELIKQSREAAN